MLIQYLYDADHNFAYFEKIYYYIAKLIVSLFDFCKSIQWYFQE